MELNNRELVLSIYLGIFFIWGLTQKDIRSSTFDLIKSFFDGKLQILFELHLIYFLLVLIFLAHIGFWDTSLLKGTISWFLFSSISLIMKTIRERNNEDFFKKLIISNFQIAVLLEYVGDLFAFSFMLEMILQFTLFSLFVFIAASETDRKFEKAKIVFNSILTLLVIILFSTTIYKMFDNYKTVFTLHNLFDFLLPINLTILYVPFLYAIALFSKYEIYFMNIDNHNKDNLLNSYAKKRLLIFANINLRKLSIFSHQFPFIQYQTKKDIDKIFNNTV